MAANDAIGRIKVFPMMFDDDRTKKNVRKKSKQELVAPMNFMVGLT